MNKEEIEIFASEILSQINDFDVEKTLKIFENNKDLIKLLSEEFDKGNEF